MTPFTNIAGRAVLLDRANIDTDQILPARFLRKPRSAGYQHFLFHDLPADRALILDASTLVAGANFGCGSSREGAVYALVDAGLRCVAAPSFGDIFAGNAAKNGLLTVSLPGADHASLCASLPGALTIDLPAERITLADGRSVPFAIDPFRKRCLVEGLDDISLTLQNAAAILAWTAQDRMARPWASRQSKG